MNLSTSEKFLVQLLRFWILAFGATTLIFIFWQTPFISLINNISESLTPALPPLTLPTEKFYLVLTTSLMVTLVFMCYQGQSNIKKNHWVLTPILVSKFTSTLFFFIYFIFAQKSLAYLVGIMSDGFVFLVTYYSYIRAKPYLLSEGN